MFNRIILIGRLTADPELKTVGQDTQLCKFTLAVDRRFKNAQGEKETDFINCTAWRKQAEIICQYVKKGHKLAIEGTLQQERWETKEGEKRSTYGVQVDNFTFLEAAAKTGEASPATNGATAPAQGTFEPPVSPDDDLPF